MTGAISLRQWNRTLLERQHLIERVDEDAVEVVDRCVGLQSQDPQAAFYALASRIEDFDPAELDSLIQDRSMVRMALQRGTVFLMDALDARWIRALLSPTLISGARHHVRRLNGPAPDEVAAVGARIIGGGPEPVTAARLRTALSEIWPAEPVDAMAAVVRAWMPLVQTPPRGLWRRSGGPAFRLLDDWIGPGEPAVAGDEAIRDLIRLYLRGFGPSTVAAVQTWSGLRGLRPVLEQMTDDWELVRLTGPDGQTLYDLDGLALADPETAVPIRLVAPFDTVIFTDADRARVADPDVYARTVTPNGQSPGFILADGRLAGTWRRTAAGVELTELVDLRPAQRRECEREARRLAELG
ncbi:winged helix DNA-binding domain-containing protein [Gordonia sihwensis]|uniref:winged helix DNA-binding domain-containing protein n=1 Tax=Gordonia TaxID=2053 RepID=UPI002417CADB|nr:winged helix DNA-binding domain-containing protein [Gordonia sihwensis]WFN92961.1 winged helix DNA-binding domain-containing protein [Gordonia sihwensis]